MSSIEPVTIPLASGPATIRTAQPTDASETIAFRVAAASESEFLSGEVGEIRTDVAEQAAFLARKLASPVDLYILAEVEGRVIGLGSLDGSLQMRFRHGATAGLAVARAYWGQGLGKGLMLALMSWADTQGLVRVALEVAETNVRAIRLYESLGFTHEGRLRCRRRHGDVYVDNYSMARIRTERDV